VKFLLFVVCALALIGLAVVQLWGGIQPFEPRSAVNRLNGVLEGLAVLTVALAALELGQTILEEEVQREEHMSAPTRVRRFLSRFLVVLVVALSIESLVIAFRASHEDPHDLIYAAAVGLTAAALLTGWGVFIRLNKSAEELEPEAMERAKREDAKVQARR
jgi:putative Mn2+ efflux pump MntP